MSTYKEYFKQANDPIVVFGSMYLGLGLLKFCNDLLNYCSKNEVNRLCFISREGGFLKEIFSSFIKNNPPVCELRTIEVIYISRNSCSSSLFNEYLVQLNLNEKALLVDIGWGGSIERSISNKGICCQYFYFGTDIRYLDLYCQNSSFISSLDKNHLLDLESGLGFIEFAMTPPSVGTTEGYMNENGKIKPILSKVMSSNNQIHEDLIYVLSRFVGSVSLSDVEHLIDSNWTSYWNDIICLKKIQVPTQLKDIYFDMGAYKVPVVINPFHHPFSFIKFYSKGLWIYGSFNLAHLNIMRFLIKSIFQLKWKLKYDR